MIIDDLRKANIEALKAKDNVSRAILGIVITRAKLLEVELRSKGQSYEDKDTLSIIQKVIKELNDEKEGYIKVGNLAKADEILKQQEVLNKYLPKQLSKEEILEEINKLDDKSIPSIMKYFKANFAGKVDMSLVSQIARSL